MTSKSKKPAIAAAPAQLSAGTYSADQVAALLQIQRKTLAARHSRGLPVPPSKLIGGRRVYPVHTFEAWFASQPGDPA